MWRHHSAQQDYGCTLAPVNPIARISWQCYNYHNYHYYYCGGGGGGGGGGDDDVVVVFGKDILK